MSEAIDMNGNGSESSAFDRSQMVDLIEATRENGTKLDTLGARIEVIATQHNNVIRYLLIVVCAIALGGKLMESVQSVWGKTPSTIITEVAK